MMEVNGVGEMIDRVRIQTQCVFENVETFTLWFGDASAYLHWQFGVVDGNVNQYSYINFMGKKLLESVEQMFRYQHRGHFGASVGDRSNQVEIGSRSDVHRTVIAQVIA